MRSKNNQRRLYVTRCRSLRRGPFICPPNAEASCHCLCCAAISPRAAVAVTVARCDGGDRVACRRRRRGYAVFPVTTRVRFLPCVLFLAVVVRAVNVHPVQSESTPVSRYDYGIT